MCDYTGKSERKQKKKKCENTNKAVLKKYIIERTFKILKGALDKFNIIPNFFPKKVGIFIPLEVLA